MKGAELGVVTPAKKKLRMAFKAGLNVLLGCHFSEARKLLAAADAGNDAEVAEVSAASTLFKCPLLEVRCTVASDTRLNARACPLCPCRFYPLIHSLRALADSPRPSRPCIAQQVSPGMQAVRVQAIEPRSRTSRGVRFVMT